MRGLQLILLISGITLWVLMAIAVLFVICEIVKNAIVLKKLRYKQKHRFDKPPTAKCYCIDCKHMGTNAHPNECTIVDRHVAENWFCNEADPKTK